MRTEIITLNKERNVTLTAYLQAAGEEFSNIEKRPAILVIPGGGYSNCSDREADPVALAYLQAGYQAFVLRYSVKQHATWPNPLDDYEQAMELIQSKADEWQLYPDKVAVVGFSAGGHLAAAAATMAKRKPAAAILGYPVIEEETAHMCLSSAPDLVSKVDAHTSPCFVFATRTDNIVPISNTIHFLDALDRNGIMFESHIYAYGPHGFSICNSSVLTPGIVICNRAPRWIEDSIAWLHDMLGDFGHGEMTGPACGKRINNDYTDYLSVDCTMGLLMKNAKAQEILAPMLKSAKERMAEKYGDRMEIGNAAKEDTQQSSGLEGMGMKITLRTVLNYGNTPEEIIRQLDEALQKIPNENQK